MYYNHNLRTDLQEWKNRLVRADYNQFGNQLKYFFDNIDNNKILKSIIDESIAKYPFTDEYFKSLEYYQRYFDRNFENAEQQLSYTFQLTKFFFKEIENYNLHLYTYFSGHPKDNMEEIIEKILMMKTIKIYILHCLKIFF
jgi:hypothetical protein